MIEQELQVLEMNAQMSNKVISVEENPDSPQREKEQQNYN